MTPSDQEKLADAWVCAQAAGTTSELYEENWWATHKLLNLEYDDPELLWQIILKILKHKDAQKVLGILGAMPLEGLMCKYGEKIIERIEIEANQNELLRECMKSVWLDSNDTPVYKRFYDIAEIEPPFD